MPKARKHRPAEPSEAGVETLARATVLEVKNGYDSLLEQSSGVIAAAKEEGRQPWEILLEKLLQTAGKGCDHPPRACTAWYSNIRRQLSQGVSNPEHALAVLQLIQQKYRKRFVDSYHQDVAEKYREKPVKNGSKRGLSRNRRYRLQSAVAQRILVCCVLAGLSDPVKADPYFIWHYALEGVSVASCDEGNRHAGQRGEHPPCAVFSNSWSRERAVVSLPTPAEQRAAGLETDAGENPGGD